MARVDLHVHSKYSDHASEWFLQRIGANESYTEPETIYRTAKAKGMDFVTITDHNKIDGSLYLAEKYPDAFTGVESTVYFPEDRCKIHILIYGLSLSEFDDIQKARNNIYDIRDYLYRRDLRYSVAHATYPVNGKITVEHLEKLILLFDVFEGINGGRNRMNNMGWTEILKSLTPEKIEQLYSRHRIEPISDTPWIKGLTGGSDDHASLFIGRTWTEAEAETTGQFLTRLQKKETKAGGRSNNFQSLAFTLYKIAHDFSRHRGNTLSNTILSKLNDLIFDDKPLTLTERYKVWRMRADSRRNGDRISGAICDLIDSLRDASGSDTENRLEIVYDRISDLTDEFGKIVINSLKKDLVSGNVSRIVTSVSASIPGIFLSLPFFTTLSHLYSSRKIIEDARERFNLIQRERKPRILWFTDTFSQANGVAVTMRILAEMAFRENADLYIVSSLPEEGQSKEIPHNFINIPGIYSFELPGYEQYNMHMPAVLRSIKIFHEFEPDEIFISTPGPVGLLGLLTGRMMNTKLTGIYHTDFTEYVDRIIEDAAVKELLDTYCHWFYQSMDRIRVPSDEYIEILARRGYDRKRMSIFDHGIDPDKFSDQPLAEHLRDFVPINGVNFLYVGRISQEKSLDFLLDCYHRLRAIRDDVNLIIVGEGPYLDALHNKTDNDERVVMTGLVRRDDLPGIYSACDAFVFPSTTDTFGMVVLEAQSCGLPCLVSDVGGPQRIVEHNRTGFVVPADDMESWVGAMTLMYDMIAENNGLISNMRRNARQNAVANFSWDHVFEDLTGVKSSGEKLADEIKEDEEVTA